MSTAIARDNTAGPYQTDGRKGPRLTRREEAERAQEAWQAIASALCCGCTHEDAARCAAAACRSACPCRCHRGGRS